MFGIQCDAHDHDQIQQDQFTPVSGAENTQGEEADQKTDDQRITADFLPEKGARFFPGDDILAAVAALVNTDRMLNGSKFIGENFCQRLQCAQPVKTLIRLFNYPRLQYGLCLNPISSDGFSLQDRRSAEMGVNLFQKGISHRRINEPQQILSQSTGGAGCGGKTPCFSCNV